MDELARIRIRLALEDLNSAFAYCLDHDRLDELADLFTEDALYTHGERRSLGRDAVREVFNARAAAGVRTVRHVLSGLRVDMESETKARGTSVCLTFAYDGPPPVTPATPYLVADFEDEYRCCADGRWRIAVRHIRRIFVAEGNPGPVGQRGATFFK
ncbi:MAG: nuclear transport factor 2 family protein [Steroidobacterales bacterium]